MTNSLMAEVSPDPAARARKSQSTILQRLAQQGMGARIAASLQVDESTVSRWKGDIERTAQILTLLGLKVVDEKKVCVPADEIGMLRRAYRLLCAHAPWVLDEEGE